MEKMTLEAFMQKVMEERKEKHNGMTLGKLYELLDEYEVNAPIFFSNGAHLDGDYDSFRGYYEDLAFDFTKTVTGKGITTVDHFKKLIEKALADGTMEGYKGGDYPITKDTLVWLGHYGTTQEAEMIVDVIGVNNAVYIVTREDDV